jgi:hypothetical protein
VASALELIGDGNGNGVRFFRLGEHHREERVNWRGERGWPGLHSERATWSRLAGHARHAVAFPYVRLATGRLAEV